ncbi:MAG: hypothetical protein QOE67_522, partial [Solirubrobacteraceae bacterium]|nr:hypothetical protein [Solirubrobacteraceae bacterium]
PQSEESMRSTLYHARRDGVASA